MSNEKQIPEWIDNFYKKWTKETKRSGGVLIGSSIKELLTDAIREFSLSGESCSESIDGQKV